MRNLTHTISVRLSEKDKQRYERLLRRFGDPLARTKSGRFRSLLVRMDIPYETNQDNPGVFDDLPDVDDEKE